VDKKVYISFELPDHPQDPSRFAIDDPCVVGTLQEQEEPVLCETFWNGLENGGFEGPCVNSLSTGDVFAFRCRPPKFVSTKESVPGTQDNPRAGRKIRLCDFKGNEVTFAGADFACFYGPDLTEPLYAHGGVVIKIDPEYLDKWYQLGKMVWKNHLGPHGLVKMYITKDRRGA